MKKISWFICMMSVQVCMLHAQSWLTAGNAGLTSANFIGTTDAKALIFKTNGIERGKIFSGGVWRFGTAPDFARIDSAGVLTFEGTAVYRVGANKYAFQYEGNNNYGLFFNATQARYEFRDGNAIPVFDIRANNGNFNFEGSVFNNNIKAISFDANNNTLLGKEAFSSNTTGSQNTAAGYKALYSNTQGNDNTANGYRALYSNVSGPWNTATGHEALYSNTTGSSNTAAGSSASRSNTTGLLNTACGADALYTNQTGSSNTATGSGALYNATGSFNTACGDGALFTTTSGSNNTALGGSADVSSGTLTNATAIGYTAVVNASNKIRLGNSAVTVIEGAVSYTVSDGRFKKIISDEVKGLAFINKLRPVMYNLQARKLDEFMMKNVPKEKRENILGNLDYSEAEKTRYSGFIAQEVENAAKEAQYTFNGLHIPEDESGNYSLAYAAFVVPLVKAVQELSEQNNEMKKRIEKLESQMNVQPLAAMQQAATLTSASLRQNMPNPFNGTTTIPYTLPQTCSSAKMIITDKSGHTVKEVNVSGSEGSVKLDASAIAAGAYQYSLYIDGRLINTKQMVITK